MSDSSFQFIAVTQQQFEHLKEELGWDLGEPRFGPEGMRLSNLNGNISFSEEQLDYLEILQIEVIPSDEIEAWLESNNWNSGG